jgi:hypothetical protein
MNLLFPSRTTHKPNRGGDATCEEPEQARDAAERRENQYGRLHCIRKAQRIVRICGQRSSRRGWCRCRLRGMRWCWCGGRSGRDARTKRGSRKWGLTWQQCGCWSRSGTTSADNIVQSASPQGGAPQSSCDGDRKKPVGKKDHWMNAPFSRLRCHRSAPSPVQYDSIGVATLPTIFRPSHVYVSTA